MSGSAASRLRAWAIQRATPFSWRQAVICAPAIPLLIAAGAALGQPVFGAVAAGAAFSVGFGASRTLGGRRWGAMAAAAAGVTLACFLGCFLGQWPAAFLAAAAVAAAACAALALYDEDLWWVTLQIVIALLVGGYYPSGAVAALQRAAAVFAGGGVEILSVMILTRLVPGPAAWTLPGPPKPPPPRPLLIGHSARAAVCVVAALLAARALNLSNSYWAPMTVMLVLKPGLSETQNRGVARLMGTLLGCAAASLYVLAGGDAAAAVMAGMAVTAGLAYGLQKAHYAMLSGAITATVVLLLTLGRGDVILNAEHRLAATVVGGLIALIVARIAPHRPLAAPGAEDRSGAGA